MAAFGGGVRIQEPPLRAEGEVLLLHPDAAPGMFSLQQFVQLYSCLVCVCLFCFTVKKVEILHTQSHPEGIGYFSYFLMTLLFEQSFFFLWRVSVQFRSVQSLSRV